MFTLSRGRRKAFPLRFLVARARLRRRPQEPQPLDAERNLQVLKDLFLSFLLLLSSPLQSPSYPCALHINFIAPHRRCIRNALCATYQQIKSHRGVSRCWLLEICSANVSSGDVLKTHYRPAHIGCWGGAGGGPGEVVPGSWCWGGATTPRGTDARPSRGADLWPDLMQARRTRRLSRSRASELLASFLNVGLKALTTYLLVAFVSCGLASFRQLPCSRF